MTNDQLVKIVEQKFEEHFAKTGSIPDSGLTDERTLTSLLTFCHECVVVDRGNQKAAELVGIPVLADATCPSGEIRIYDKGVEVGRIVDITIE